MYIASSLDGYIAGPDDDLSWLPADPVADPGRAVTFDAFMAEVGAMLMGRRTYDVVSGFDGPWPYAVPVLVATHRPLDPEVPSVGAISDTIDGMIDTARVAAAGADVYLDGAALVQQALRADLVDELIVTVVPVLLGAGTRLFGPLEDPLHLRFHPPVPYGSMVQLRATRPSAP